MCIKPWVDSFAWSMSQCCSSTCCTSTIVTCGHTLWVKQTAPWSSFLHPATWRHWGELVTQSLHKLMLHAYLQVCGSWQQPCSSERKSGSRHCMYRFPWGEPQQVNTQKYFYNEKWEIMTVNHRCSTIKTCLNKLRRHCLNHILSYFSAKETSTSDATYMQICAGCG